MVEKKEIERILDKYGKNLDLVGKYYDRKIISDKQRKNVIKKIAPNEDKDTIIGILDMSLFNDGKEAIVFTDEKFYYRAALSEKIKVWYDDITDIKILYSYEKEEKKEIEIVCNDGIGHTIQSSLFNKTPLKKILGEIGNLYENKSVHIDGSNIGDNLGDYRDSSAVSGGVYTADYQTVNRVYDEEKFHASKGHGFAAERANNQYDILHGKKAKIVGDDNAKNGADRIVDGVEIQSKYCKTGSKCISECFEDGKMRYTIENGTKPMQIEVPADKYDSAVQAMENKIKKGQVPGVTDPAEAKNIVRKGHYTYEQAKNIAKAGNIDSLKYDATNGAITAASAFGVSATISFAVSIWNGEDFEIAIKRASFTGLKIGGTAFISSVLASQLAKAGLNSMLVGSTEVLAKIMGSKASAVIINAFRSGKNIYGAAAQKSAAKLLRGNIITSGAMIVVLSSIDIANIFQGKISGKQLFKNITNTTTSVAGGVVGGILGGAAAGSVVPGVGTVIGGLFGAVAAGTAASKASGTILDQFIEDDAEELVRKIQHQFEQLAKDYLLSRKEAEKVADKLSDVLDGKILKEMYASENKYRFADELLIPLVESVVSMRGKVQMPSEEEMKNALIEVLEDISEESESAPCCAN